MMTSLLGHTHPTGHAVLTGPSDGFLEWMLELAAAGFSVGPMRVGRTRC